MAASRTGKKGDKKMKRAFIFAIAVFVLVACNKENNVIENDYIDASKIVFNIRVSNADATDTKGVKTAWENGDDVYVFFEDNTTQYIKMTYNEGVWSYKDKTNGTSFSGLVLTASGKKLTAVYMPDFVCSAAPTHDGSKWTFGSISGYYQTAVNVSYTVTSTDDVNTLDATINLTAPTNMMQIYVDESDPSSHNEYVMTATHVIPFTFSGISADGTAIHGTTTNGFPLTAYKGTIAGESGYYFWGILEGTGTYDFFFQLVQRNVSKKYAVSSKSKTVNGASITGATAIKLTLVDKGKFVSLGYSGGPLWATGNLKDADDHIADPSEAGDYYMWGDLRAIDPVNYANLNSFSNSAVDIQGTEEDTAKKVSGNANWKMPTKEQFEALKDSNNTLFEKSYWTDSHTSFMGYLLTSKLNGIVLGLPFAGWCYNGNVSLSGSSGDLWSSTPSTSDGAYYLEFDPYYYKMDSWGRSNGVPVRPIID